MTEQIIYIKKDFLSGRSIIKKYTPCSWHGAIDKKGYYIVAPRGKSGNFYMNRHIPPEYF
jgi:hypothetical protein